MKIRHKEHGDVEGVERTGVSGFNQWEKEENGRISYFNDFSGWSEVKDPRYVDVTWNLKIEGRDLTLYRRGGFERMWTAIKVLPDNYRLKLCYWFDLPENLMHEIYHMTPKGFVDYVQRYRKPCLIVEKEE